MRKTLKFLFNTENLFAQIVLFVIGLFTAWIIAYIAHLIN